MTRSASKLVRAKSILQVLAVPVGFELDCLACASLGWGQVEMTTNGIVEAVGYATPDSVYWLTCRFGLTTIRSPSRTWTDFAYLLADCPTLDWKSFKDKHGGTDAESGCRALILARRGHWP